MPYQKKYILVLHTDTPGESTTVIICDTPEQREQRTIEEIYGDNEDNLPFTEKHALEEDKIVYFEGDAPVEWMESYVLYVPERKESRVWVWARRIVALCQRIVSHF